MSQEQFANLFGVSRQSVQKWETGESTPDIEKLVKICKQFDVSLDSLVLDRDAREVNEIAGNTQIVPQYNKMQMWDFYTSNGGLSREFEQCVEEGLDIEAYRDVFKAVSMLPTSEEKEQLADILFHIILNTKQRSNFSFTEPNDLNEIKALRRPYPLPNVYNKTELPQKIKGAWVGRICGCFLGKKAEGVKTQTFIDFLKETNNFPMHRYLLSTDFTKEREEKYNFPTKQAYYADIIESIPSDDDTNYTVLAQILIEEHGRDFTPLDVANIWLENQNKNAYCTAERVAYCNFIKGYLPPDSASHKNPYREWIGAQIRGDYFGYINPGNPELAAEMAYRDACISHTKNGIYGEMFVAAMLAAAAVTNNMEQIVLAGMAQIPATSRLYKELEKVLADYRAGLDYMDIFAKINKDYKQYEGFACHTIPNAMIVAAALLCGRGDYAKSICLAVQVGYDTDCNGATVGSVVGLAQGINAIPEYWQQPTHNTLQTTIFKVGNVNINEVAEKTLKHIEY